MKRMISLLAAVMLISSCGTAPRADLLSESRVTSGLDEEQGDSEMTHYLIGGAIVVVALCTVVPGAKRACQKQFMSADKFKGMLGNRIKKLDEKIADLKKADANADTEKLEQKKKKIEGIKDEVGDKGDGIFYRAYNSTLGKLFNKDGKQAAKTGEEAGENADASGKQAKSEGGDAKATEEAGENADASGKQAKSEGGDAKATEEASENADAGKQAKSEGDEAKASSDADDASKQSTEQQK